MRSRITFGRKLALAAIVLGFGGAALAQSSGDTSAANVSVTTSTTMTTVTPSTPATDAAMAPVPPMTSTDSQPAPSAPRADNPADTSPQAMVTPPSSIERNAPIGANSLSRSDSPNTAFAKLDAQNRGFLSRSDLSQLPDFGNAFAQADRDGDGRLDRSEFADAWSSYVDQSVSVETTTTTITHTQ